MEKGFTFIIFLLVAVLATTVGLVAFNQKSLPKTQVSSLIPLTPKPAESIASSVLTVSEVMDNPQNYLEKRVSVQGKLFLHTYYGAESARPCPDSQPNCTDNETKPPTLHLVNPENPWGETENIDLYRTNSSGSYEQISCQNTTSCGPYSPNSITTIQGLFTKNQVPYQTVGNSSGKIEVIKSKDHYFLVVE